jgi:hypothetical protein
MYYYTFLSGRTGETELKIEGKGSSSATFPRKAPTEGDKNLSAVRNRWCFTRA